MDVGALLGCVYTKTGRNLSEPNRREFSESSLRRAPDLMEARTLPSTRSFFSLPTLITAIFKMKKSCIVPPALLPEVLRASAKMLPLHSSLQMVQRDTRHENSPSEGRKSVTYCLRATCLQQELNTAA